MLEDLLRVLQSKNNEERQAAQSALAASRDPRARQLLATTCSR
jgi:hypothetical protein